MRRSYLLLAWLAIVSCACSGRTSPTQLLVIVDSSIEYGRLTDRELAQIEVRLLSSDGSRWLTEPETIELRSFMDFGAPELPLSFALTPQAQSQRGLFRLVITGKNWEGHVLIQQQVFTAFRQGEARVLDVLLTLPCLEVTCHGEPLPGDLTCQEGKCREIPTRTDLEALDGDGLSQYDSPFAQIHAQRWADAGAVSPPVQPEGGFDGAASADDAGTCRLRWFSTTPMGGDMLLVFDRSMPEALSPVVAAAQKLRSVVNLGLYRFPSDAMCGAGELVVPIAADSGQAIADQLSGLSVLGFRPTGSALSGAREVLSRRTGAEADRPAFVLLLSSGEPSCDGASLDQAQAEAARMEVSALRNDNVLTYVAGRATGRHAAFLAELGTLGGTGGYRAVADDSQWASVAQSIVAELSSCVVRLEQAPVTPLIVLLRGTAVNTSEIDGWTLNGDTLLFHGQACQMLQTQGRSGLLVQACL